MAERERKRQTQQEYYDLQSEQKQNKRLKYEPVTQHKRIHYPSLKPYQRDKLKEIFQHIISKAPIDFCNNEILDIYSAVKAMLEKIRTRVNRRGIFNVARVVPTGSMGERTSLWKFHGRCPYLEMDFLARLDHSIKECEDQTTRNSSKCQGCIGIGQPPVDLGRLGQFYDLYEYNAVSLTEKDKISDVFLNEINYCLCSSCNCLSFQSEKNQYNNAYYKIAIQSSTAIQNQGCGECTIDMPTGTLYVNTEIDIDQYTADPNDCSLIFIWRSKTKTLLAPDRLLLQEPRSVSSVPIYVDFRPGLESRTPSLSGTGEQHNFFIVPKICNVCAAVDEDDDGGDDDDDDDGKCKWRKSWCIAELTAFTTEISDNHKHCYQFIKSILEVQCYDKLPNYHIKTIVLRHNTTCSDTRESYVNCVMEIFCDLIQTYKSEELLSYQADLNIIKGHINCLEKHQRCVLYIKKLCSVTGTDTWETFIRKLQEP